MHLKLSILFTLLIATLKIVCADTTIYNSEGWDGGYLTTYSTSYSVTYFFFLPKTTTYYYIKTPRFHSSTTTTSFLNELEYKLTSSLTARSTGYDGYETYFTTVVVYYPEYVSAFTTSTRLTYYTGQSPSFITKKTNVITGSDSSITTLYEYIYGIPNNFYVSTITSVWTNNYLETSESLITTRGTDDSSTTGTVYYIFTTRNPGLTLTTYWTGNSVSFLSTSVSYSTDNYFIIFSTVYTTTYYIMAVPSYHMSSTKTTEYLGKSTITLSTKVYSITDSSGFVTFQTLYYVGTPIRLSARTVIKESNINANSKSTYSTNINKAIGQDGFETTVYTYYVFIPTNLLKQTITQAWTGSYITTKSTSLTTAVDVDGNSIISTVYFIYTTRNPGIYVNRPWSGTYTTVYSTEVSLSTEFFFFVAITTYTSTYYYVKVPLNQVTKTSYVAWSGDKYSTYKTDATTYTGGDDNLTEEITLYVYSKAYFSSTTNNFRGGTGTTPYLFGQLLATTTGENGYDTTVTTYYIAIPDACYYTTTTAPWDGWYSQLYSQDLTEVIGIDNLFTTKTIYYIRTPLPWGIFDTTYLDSFISNI
ncbi:hypothetical protein Kpol_1000p8 [Vanderwaltozyma polyspora DSM 70294]|uniref:Uncharacterized protein n=1 Tax=Vanderwaltozyma polyspora (strain ATCC 22028 / DSM 70294 / BCRC 21397 / CBS 2163 / NBRC 10782 / NRRL Y-8283 / UCD 57-17) TaxID=436907 RepID=A7TPU9_VANPO|nr:uncharacterized protein Kpol_1000p8 [Vanderwaltozyma polyspora DSM 70294]EDO15697.1 hypothetical protein Kpol_1000p8 [Vanderwaltozyma polyspora DSM 70294]